MKRREFLASVALTGVSATVLSQEHFAELNSPLEFSRFLKAQLLPNYQCWGYEGFLSDGYLVLLAAAEIKSEHGN
jgi:hypothetical protein